MKYWINTISYDHVQRGVAGGFTQANHGKRTNPERLQKGDWMIFYSPKTTYEDGEPLQAFTAIGQVDDDEPYRFEMSPGFEPWRRKLRFIKCKTTSIRPLFDELEFITDKQHWGYKFRFGLFEISAHDYEIIRTALTGSLLE